MEGRVRPTLFKRFLSTGEDARLYLGPLAADEFVERIVVWVKMSTTPAVANTRLEVEVRVFAFEPADTDADFAVGDALFSSDSSVGLIVPISIDGSVGHMDLPLYWSPGSLPHRWIGVRLDADLAVAGSANTAVAFVVRKKGM